MPHAQQTRPPNARSVWRKRRHPMPKRPTSFDFLLDTALKYAPKGH